MGNAGARRGDTNVSRIDSMRKAVRARRISSRVSSNKMFFACEHKLPSSTSFAPPSVKCQTKVLVYVWMGPASILVS